MFLWLCWCLVARVDGAPERQALLVTPSWFSLADDCVAGSSFGDALTNER